MYTFYGYRGMKHGGNGEWDWTASDIEVVSHDCGAEMERRTLELRNNGSTLDDMVYASNVRKYCGIPDHVGIRVMVFKDGTRLVGLVRELPAGTIVKIGSFRNPTVEFSSLDPLNQTGASSGGGTPVDEQWMGKEPESYY